ncbi:MAG: hypothetical protein G01um101425_1005 [Candidatus Peregrinibacteria bacterium Gr01-1014_25]|nr:MAG: hypothetical protein G01um101425_1005 [Candidatus Peregrinibacteria bacterium Gr01-1014_25]
MVLPSVHRRHVLAAVAACILFAAFTTVAYASHSWGGFHWPRSANPLTLNVGDNVSSVWDPYLDGAIADWNTPVGGYADVMNLVEVTGATRPKTCKPTAGRVEVCNSRYGNNGWLGIAQVWVSGTHITQATTKLNDTYFTTATYNTPAWRRLVTCQEIAHDFGLDHQDENFSNANVGSCMDYTNDPDGPPSNEHPNAHDFEQLEAIYGGHFDGGASAPGGTGGNGQDIGDDPSTWGQLRRSDAHGKPALYERDLGNGHKVFTFVVWTEEARGHHE